MTPTTARHSPNHHSVPRSRSAFLTSACLARLSAPSQQASGPALHSPSASLTCACLARVSGPALHSPSGAASIPHHRGGRLA
jgi:hypothetical protein